MGHTYTHIGLGSHIQGKGSGFRVSSVDIMQATQRIHHLENLLLYHNEKVRNPEGMGDTIPDWKVIYPELNADQYGKASLHLNPEP